MALLLLVMLLFWEYRRMQWHIDRVQLLQEQYYSYIDAVKRLLKKEEAAVVEPKENDDEQELDSFLVINRSPSYLKDETFSYLKAQRLDGLLQRINPHEWDDYTDQVINGVHQPIIKAKKVQKVESSKKSYNASGWKTKKPRQKTTTGIIFALPIDPSRFWISSFFGPRKKPSGQWGFHYGLDMAAHRGTPAKSIAAGVVEQAEYVSGYGNTVLVHHDAVYKSRYAHLDSISVHKGDTLKQGTCVGKVGDTGFTLKTGKDASHLHLELYENGKQINPLHLLPI